MKHKKEIVFEQKSGMSLDTAWEKVQNWYNEGKIETAEQGAEFIVDFFPLHPAAEFLEKLKKENSNPESENIFKQNSDKKEDKETIEKPDKMTVKETINALITGKRPERIIIAEQERKNSISETLESSQEEKKEKNIMEAIGISTDKTDFTEHNLPDENDVLDDERSFGALSYIFPFFFFTLMTRKESGFIQFHAWQGFTLWVIIFIFIPVYLIFKIIPGLGILFWIIFTVLIISSFLSAYTAWKGKYIFLPIVSDFAKQLSGTTQENE